MGPPPPAPFDRKLAPPPPPPPPPPLGPFCRPPPLLPPCLPPPRRPPRDEDLLLLINSSKLKSIADVLRERRGKYKPVNGLTKRTLEREEKQNGAKKNKNRLLFSSKALWTGTDAPGNDGVIQQKWPIPLDNRTALRLPGKNIKESTTYGEREKGVNSRTKLFALDTLMEKKARKTKISKYNVFCYARRSIVIIYSVYMISRGNHRCFLIFSRFIAVCFFLILFVRCFIRSFIYLYLSTVS